MSTYAHPQGHVFYRKMAHKRPKVVKSAGIYLYDETGKEYIDGSGGPLVINVGHSRLEVIEAMTQQATAVAYAHAIMFTSDPLEAYAEALAEIVPLPHPRFFFLSSGSEVVEASLKLARQIQMARGESNRHLIISRTQSYHGMSLGALSVSGRPGLRAPFLNMMHDMPHVAPPYTYRNPLTGKQHADLLEETILAHGAENVAGFIAEPISGASLGAAQPPDDYWTEIRAVCDKHGVLLIADEVLVGMGRTGKWWGIEHWNVTPDILVTSKGAAGGYFPLGWVAAKGSDVDLLQQKLGDFNHGGTFSHHAVGASAGLATLRILKDENLVDNAKNMGDLLGKCLHETFGDHPHVGDIRGRGLFWGLELVQDKVNKTPFPAEKHVAWDIWQQAFDLGLIVYYSQGCADGKNGDLVMFGPPLIVNESQIKEMVARLATAFKLFRF